MRASTIVGFVVLAALAIGLGVTAWRMFSPAGQHACAVCTRPIHDGSHVTAELGGEQQAYCCAACLLTEGRQQDAQPTNVRLYDYLSGDPLEPDEVVLVVGSEVNLCMREHVLMGEHKEAGAMHFDRCAPSILAFGNRSAAQTFRQANGGEIKGYAEVRTSFR